MAKRKKMSDRHRRAIYVRDSWTCQYCGLKFDPDNTWNAGSVAPFQEHERLMWIFLEIDHVHPVFLGGTNDPENLVSACTICNRAKSFKVLEAIN